MPYKNLFSDSPSFRGLLSGAVAVCLVALIAGCGGKPVVQPVPTNGVVEVTQPGDPGYVPFVATNAVDVTNLQPAQPAVKERPLPTAPISVTTLKALLPETIRGFTMDKELARTNSNTTVSARRAFVGEGGSYVFFEIKDMHRPGYLRIENPYFFDKEKVKETDEFLSTLTELEGFPCWEREGKLTKSSKIQVLMEDRVLVDLMGWNVSMQDLRPMMRFYDLSLVQEHVKEEIRQQEYKARLERQQQQNAAQTP